MASQQQQESTNQAALFDPNAKNEMMDRNSRNADALGLDTMRNLTSLSILVVGMKGVGVETAKNLVLAGPGRVTLHDDELPVIADLGTNFYLRPEHVGKVSRAQASLPQVRSLHPYCKTDVYEGKLTPAVLGQYGCVIVTVMRPKKELFEINEFCRSKGITFILAMTHGLTASIFADHGAEHLCTDIDGNPSKELVIDNVDVGAEGGMVVSVNSNHGFDDGHGVLFSKMEGSLAWLNGLKGVKIKRKYNKVASLDKEGKELLDSKGNVKYRNINDLKKFVVDLSGVTAPANLGSYKSGGYVTDVKPTKVFKFRSLEESLADPHVNPAHCLFDMSTFAMRGTVYHPDQWKRERGLGDQNFAALCALFEFVSAHDGQLPRLHSREDALEAIRLAKEGIAFKTGGGPVNETVVYKTALYARTEVPGYCAFLGGVAAQEVMKRWGKWTPLHQWMVLDELNLLQGQPTCPPDWHCMDDCSHKRPPIDSQPLNSRYDHQIALFGQGFQRKLGNQRWFLVGCGALGCEYLKGIAMMGVGAGERGLITVTDMDTIELSNLSRQFLFREQHLGHFKSAAATQVALGMNPDLNFRVLQEFVGPSTENIFTDEFWNDQDGIWNALDNVKARKYTDRKCLLHGLPLLESGTEGTKTNSEVILPFKTSTYNDGTDMPTEGIAQCTLRNFPSTIVHCIEWAKPMFSELFFQAPSDYNTLLSDKEKFLELADNQEGQQLAFLEKMKRFHEQFQDRSFQNCIKMAFEVMDAQYTKRIKDLVHLFPEDARKKNKKGEDVGPFWSGTKRFPSHITLKYRCAEEEAALKAVEAEIAEVEKQPEGEKRTAVLEELEAKRKPIAEQVACVKTQLAYLYNGANLFAAVMGVSGCKDEEEFIAELDKAGLKHPEWKEPDKNAVDLSGDGADDDDDENNADGSDDDDDDGDDDMKVWELRQWFEKLDTSAIKAYVPQKFEKDDDENFHVDWIAAASNLRAYNYRIDMATRHRVKMVAGNIIPALATTTALITGLIELELYKYVLGLSNQSASAFRNAQVNLGLSTFEMAEPPAAIKMEDSTQVFVDQFGVPEKKTVTKVYPRGQSFTSWNFIDWHAANQTIGEFVDSFPAKYHGVRVSNLSAGELVLYPPVLTSTLQYENNIAAAKHENQKRFYRKQLEQAQESNARKMGDVRNKTVIERFLELGGSLPTASRNYLVLEGNFDVPDNGQEAKENVAVDPEDGLACDYDAAVPKIRFFFKRAEVPAMPGSKAAAGAAAEEGAEEEKAEEQDDKMQDDA